MKGRGSLPSLIVLGLLVAVGCGGRTDSFGDYYGSGNGDDDDDSGGSAIAGGGATSIGGKPAKAGTHSGGTKPVGGKGGTTSVAGSAPAGGSIGVGGTINVGGTISTGGSPFGGFGGTISFGGFAGSTFGGFAGFGGEPDCQTCVLQACGSQLIECVQDFGCIAIIGCAQATGCTGINCYSDKYCKGVIDEWGGPAGSSMNELLQTFACTVNSGCSCN
jgi:hypothetical protein